jgi:phage shock protein A
MEAFNIGDDASTFNEMREKIERRVASAEAKLQLSTSSVDAQMQDIEREAMDIQLQDKLLEYKKQMGLLEPSASTENKQLSSGASAKESSLIEEQTQEGKQN